MDDLERQICGTADKIRYAEKAARRYDKALEGRDFMIRWTTKGAPGETSYDSIPVTVDDVRIFLETTLKPDVHTADQEAKDAVSDLIGACQPGAGDC